MGKSNKTQTNFSSGQLSDKVKGRIDLREYESGAEVVENFIIQKQGGVFKRPGSQFVNANINDDFEGKKIMPFIFSKTESYVIVMNQEANAEQIKIFRTDGTAATVDARGLIKYSQVMSVYDVSNWKYAQSGDIMFLTYGEDETNLELETGASSAIGRRPAPILLYRTSRDEFVALSYAHPDFYPTYSPASGKFSPAVTTPYLDSNVDPDLRMYVSSTSEGTGRTLFMVDRANNPVPFFKLGHTFADDGTNPVRIGAFFRVQSGGTEGVAWGQTWEADTLVASLNIDTATDIFTVAGGHNFVTGDVARISTTTTNDDSMTLGGVTLEAGGTGGVYGDYFIRAITGTTMSLHTTLNDAQTGTNLVDVLTAGTEIIRFVHFQKSQITVTVEETFPAATSAGTATDDWKESSWSAERGFPRAVTFHEQRVFFGGSERNPDTIWASQTGNIFNMMQTRLEQDETSVSTGLSTLPFILFGDTRTSDPFSFTIASKQANIIQWLESQNTLQAGSLGSEYIIDGGNAALSNENILIRKQTDYGSSNVQSVAIGHSTLFITRDGRRLREFKFNDENGSYISSNLSVLSDFMVYSGFDGASASELKDAEFVEIVHQPTRDVIWLVTNKGQLVGVTLSREANIVAWHYHPTRSTDTVNSVISVPNENRNFDELWMSVTRNVNGVDKTYLEKIGDDFEHDLIANTSTEENDKPYYSDSAVKVTLATATDTVTLPQNVTVGLGTESHLEGETVKILAGNTVETDKTVSSGQVTLDASYPSGTEIFLGLPYTSTLKTMDLEAGGDFGDSQGNRQRIDRLAIRLYLSQRGGYKNPDGSLYDLEYDDNEAFSGTKRLDFEITPDMENQVIFEHDDPVPFNILSLTYRSVAYD